MIAFFLSTATALLLATPVAGHVIEMPADASELEIRALLAIERVSLGGRGAVFIDPIEEMLVRGTWSSPSAGEEVTAATGDRHAWQPIEANDRGRFQHPTLSAGYALANVVSERRRIVLLDARGHRHVYVGGQPRAGDVFDNGLTLVPVVLEQGANELLFKGGRGRLKARLVDPPAAVFLQQRDQTVPDLIEGETEPLSAGIVVTNATEEHQQGLKILVSVDGRSDSISQVPDLPPLCSRKVAIRIVPPTPAPEQSKVPTTLRLFDAGGTELHQRAITLSLRKPSAMHRRTFISGVDGSVQYFAVMPSSGEAAASALFLTFHGAGVEATNQANAYQPRDWGHVVAPTNRRPYGFDWEDWGRLDALEVLDVARQRWNIDPVRIYLTGHSMGGHGVWNFGCHHADLFAAIAPSAGWRDFWSYGGGIDWSAPTPVQEFLMRAANASRTLLLERNLATLGVYILHGDRDDNVPVSQARFMRERLGTFHTNWAYYERPGAGHWWGNQCVDWPPLFRFLRDNTRREDHLLPRVRFSTVSPGIADRFRWVTIEAQQKSMAASTIDVSLDPKQRLLEVTSENVARLRLDLSSFAEPRTATRKGETVDTTILPAGEPLKGMLDGQSIEAIAWPSADAVLSFSRGREDGVWRLSGKSPAAWKGAARCGPFKDAFRNNMVFVYGTGGSPAEQVWAFSKARYDAETFQYRANGSVDLIADTQFDPQADPDRNVILYGRQDTNSAWNQVLDSPPFSLQRGRLKVGERVLQADDLALLAIYPRSASAVASVAVIGGTGVTGMRLTNQLPYFVSGVGYPDWTVLDTTMLAEGSAGVVGTGFFDGAWASSPDDQAWRDEADGG